MALNSSSMMAHQGADATAARAAKPMVSWWSQGAAKHLKLVQDGQWMKLLPARYGFTALTLNLGPPSPKT